MVALGRALGMSVVIEGVETEEQRVLLRLAGCNEMQGYLFCKPTTARGDRPAVGEGGGDAGGSRCAGPAWPGSRRLMAQSLAGHGAISLVWQQAFGQSEGIT